jgi:hypothetical protein
MHNNSLKARKRTIQNLAWSSLRYEKRFVISNWRTRRWFGATSKASSAQSTAKSNAAKTDWWDFPHTKKACLILTEQRRQSTHHVYVYTTVRYPKRSLRHEINYKRTVTSLLYMCIRGCGSAENGQRSGAAGVRKFIDVDLGAIFTGLCIRGTLKCGEMREICGGNLIRERCLWKVLVKQIYWGALGFQYVERPW